MPTALSAIDLAKRNGSTYLNTRLGLACVGSALTVLAWKWRREENSIKFLENIQSLDCGLATDHLEDSNASTVEVLEGEQTTVYRGEICANEVPGYVEADDLVVRGVASIVSTPVEVTAHRRVRPGRGMKYMNCVLAECKNKFGTPSATEANRKAVQRFAHNIMSKHGLRPSHVRQYLPMIVTMTFVPTKEEQAALVMLNSAAAVESKIKYLLSEAASGFISIN